VLRRWRACPEGQHRSGESLARKPRADLAHRADDREADQAFKIVRRREQIDVRLRLRNAAHNKLVAGPAKHLVQPDNPPARRLPRLRLAIILSVRDARYLPKL
jgi:hypothetical protein